MSRPDFVIGEIAAAMYQTRYFQVQEVLDEFLGTEEEDGAGEGIEADVRLLGEQRDRARELVAALEAQLAEVERTARDWVHRATPEARASNAALAQWVAGQVILKILGVVS